MSAPTADVEKLARKVGLELIGKSGSEVEAILAKYFAQASAPLVELLVEIRQWILDESSIPPTILLDKIAALTGTNVGETNQRKETKLNDDK